MSYNNQSEVAVPPSHRVKWRNLWSPLALDNESQRSRIVDIELLLTPTDENHGAVTPGPTETSLIENNDKIVSIMMTVYSRIL